jgi:hypothetical protein
MRPAETIPEMRRWEVVGVKESGKGEWWRG